MDKLSAQSEILDIIKGYKTISSKDRSLMKALTDGKLYELFVLSKTLKDLRHRGFSIKFVGNDIKFKSSPGAIKSTDPHFEIFAPGESIPSFKLFTDIEVQTLGGCLQKESSDNSCYHEIDIVVVDAEATGRPQHDQIALGVECKATENFDKSIVREALGLRRELSLLRGNRPSRLSKSGQVNMVEVPAEPASEYWLAFIHSKGLNYAESPSAFGVKFQHWEP